MIGFFVKYIQKKTPKKKKPIRARKKNLRRAHQNNTKISIQLQKQKSSMITIPSSQLYHLHSSRIKPETLLFLFFFPLSSSSSPAAVQISQNKKIYLELPNIN